MAKKSALNKSPSQTNLTYISPGIYRNQQGQRVNSRGERIDARGRKVKPTGETKPPGRVPAQTAPQQPKSPYEQPQQQIATNMGQYLQQMQEKGAFEPGSFAEQQQQAFDTVMQRFRAASEPKFAKERADFAQMAAERGLDPNSEAYRAMQRDLYQNQQAAQQEAQLMANQAAQDVGAQAFSQAATQYQMPAQMFGALGPAYAEMGAGARLGQEQQFKREMFPMESEQRLREIAAQGSANARAAMAGRTPYEEAARLQRERAGLEIAVNAAQQGQQLRPPNFMTSFGQGLLGAAQNAPNTINRRVK